MKVLLLGDASNYHASLAQGLARLGHAVTVASNGGAWLGTARNIDLSRRPTRLSGALLLLKVLTTLSERLSGYDVVQLSSPGFLDLRPVHLERILRRLRRRNGALFLSALGTDSALVRNLSGPHPALGYSEWQIGGKATAWADSPASHRTEWLRPHLRRYTDVFYHTVDGAVTALYEYQRIIEAEYPRLPAAYAGIPIDTSALPTPSAHLQGRKVRILYAVHPGREGEKGADILHGMLCRLEREIPDSVEIMRPGPLPYAEFVKVLGSADMVCDQLYSYTPSTTPLLGMAMGTVPITGGEDDFYRFIGEDTLRPIFNPDPRDTGATYSRLKALVTDRDALRRLSAQGPEFVARHNDAATVARRFEAFWEKNLELV